MKNVILLLLLVASGVMIYVFALPAWESLTPQRQEFARIEETKKRYAEIEEKKNELRDRYNSITEEDRGSLDKIVPEGYDKEKTALLFREFAERAGLAMDAVNLSANASPSSSGIGGAGGSGGVGLGTVKFSFSLEGTYDNFLNYLELVERNIKLINITSVSFSSPANTADDVVFSVSGETYFSR